MNKQIKRELFLEELKLRKLIRQAIVKVVESRNRRKLLEEKVLRKYIRKVLKETKVSDVEPTPNKSTGINILEELLKKIIPILETDYKRLTTDNKQRISFRSHIINACKNILAPPEVNVNAADQKNKKLQEQDESDELELVDDNEEFGLEDPDQENQLDDENLDQQDPEEQEFIDIAPKKKTDKEIEVDSFSLPDHDETGRNMAFQTFKKVESSIIDAYDLLSNDEDREIFYDYLLTNLKMYFDKFEDDLMASIEEPTTDEYEQSTGGQEEQGLEQGF